MTGLAGGTGMVEGLLSAPLRVALIVGILVVLASSVGVYSGDLPAVFVIGSTCLLESASLNGLTACLWYGVPWLFSPPLFSSFRLPFRDPCSGCRLQWPSFLICLIVSWSWGALGQSLVALWASLACLAAGPPVFPCFWRGKRMAAGMLLVLSHFQKVFPGSSLCGSG
jgi:hypothetical protein